MAISNGNPVLAFDLGTMTSTALLNVGADNGQGPLGHEQTHTFFNIVGGGTPTSAQRSKAIFVVPFDCFVESLVAVANDLTNGSTVNVALTSAGVLDAFPLAVSQTVVTGAAKLTRILYDNSRANAAASYMASNPALRLLPKGATVVVTVSTTSTATPSSIQVTLVLRSYFNRG